MIKAYNGLVDFSKATNSEDRLIPQTVGAAYLDQAGAEAEKVPEGQP